MIEVFKHDLNRVLNENFWPLGVRCKLWWDRKPPFKDPLEGDGEMTGTDDQENISECGSEHTPAL